MMTVVRLRIKLENQSMLICTDNEGGEKGAGFPIPLGDMVRVELFASASTPAAIRASNWTSSAFGSGCSSW